MVVNDSTFIPKNPHSLFCNLCDYNTSSPKDFKKHLLTLKHEKRINGSKMVVNDSEKSQNIPKIFACICGKTYKYDSGFYRHKKQCLKDNSNQLVINPIKRDVKYQEHLEQLTKTVLDVVKQNNELTKQIIELSSNQNMDNCYNNNNNKTFNLQFFLNEQCKDALNINDFVESIQLQLSDLENTGKVGYVEGISKIFINNLEQLNTHKRPIHCSDLKREILYIKDENQWVKEGNDKEKIQKAIKQVANKNIMQISKWQKENPDCFDSSSKKNNQYIKIVSNSMSGSTSEEQQINISKIIKNVAKEVVIEK